jgi:hypothetical protein
MTFSSTLVRRAGVVTVALGLAVGATAAPTLAKPAKDKSVDCIDYGTVAKAPKGAIPRDDQHVVKHDPLKIEAAKAAKASSGRVSAAAVIPTVPDPAFDVTVPVRFHEIIKTQGNGGGDLSDARLQAQVDALNAGYAGTGFEFVYDKAGSTETVQPEWFNLVSNGAEVSYFRGGGKEVAMKKALSSQDSSVLDVYTASLGQFLLGWAWFPSDFTDATTSEYGPLHRYFDGVVIDFRTVPAVDEDPDDGEQRVFPDDTYELGDTLTHEVGHWLELYHTFQDGCAGVGVDKGDRIADTPAEASPNFLCPEPGDEPRDTCLDDPGYDPINNYMDYSFDVCLTEFTSQQAARMQFAWNTYRG